MEVRRCWNNLVLDEDYEVVCLGEEPLSPNQIIKQGNLVFERPVMCLVGSDFWSRADWDCIVPQNAVVRFVELPCGTGGGKSNPLRTLATIVVSAAAMAAGAALLPILGPFGAGLVSAGIMILGTLLINAIFGPPGGKNRGRGEGDPDPMYSISGGSNRLRIGEPYAESFGRIKIFPDLAQVPYTSIKNNEQYLYFLGIIGVGHYDIEEVYIDKTPIAEYDEASYHIVSPGSGLTIAREVCWTSSEANGQELDHEDWLSFVANPAGTVALEIEFDVVFPGGLIRYDDEGDKHHAAVGIIAETRAIDADAQPLGEWGTFYTRDYVFSQIDPLRFSIRLPARQGAGRFEFRVKRKKAKSKDSKCTDRAMLGGLRAYGGAHPTVPCATLLECKIKATEKLSGNVANKINVIATRKLNTWNSNGVADTSTFKATRSPVDAIVYIIASCNGGRLGKDPANFHGNFGNFGDKACGDILYALRQKFEEKQWYFDWRFTSRTGVMEASAQIAKLLKCVPYMPGGKFAIVEDKLQTVPSAIFAAKDITKDSLSVVTAFRTEKSPTCVKITYVNPISWQPQTIDCYDEQGSLTIPLEVTLEGCTSRQHAWEIGMYLYWDMMRTVTTVQFDVGLKGHLVSMFSKVVVADETVDWGQSGVVWDATTDKLVLSEPVDFRGQDSGQIYLTTTQGSPSGPHTVTPTDIENEVSTGQDLSDLVNLAKNQPETASGFVFGALAQNNLFIRVMSITPKGQDSIGITGQVIDSRVYGAPGNAPAIGVWAPDDFSAVVFWQGGDQFQLNWKGMYNSVEIEAHPPDMPPIVQVLTRPGEQFFTVQGLEKPWSTRFTVYASPFLPNGTLGVKVDAKWQDGDNPNYDLIENVRCSFKAKGVFGGSFLFEWDSYPASDVVYDIRFWLNDKEVNRKETTKPKLEVTKKDMFFANKQWVPFTIKVAPIMEDGRRGHFSALDVSPLELVEGCFNLPAVNLRVVQRMDEGVVLAWNAVQGVSEFHLKRDNGIGSDFNPITQGVECYKGGETQALVAGLNMSQPHHFRIGARDTDDEEEILHLFAFSTEVVSVLPEGMFQTPDYIGLYCSQTLTEGFVLNWSSLSGAIGYVVAYGMEPAFNPNTAALLYDGSLNRAVILGLNMTPNLTYYFRVAGYSKTAWRQSDLIFSQQVLACATPPPPPPP